MIHVYPTDKVWYEPDQADRCCVTLSNCGIEETFLERACKDFAEPDATDDFGIEIRFNLAAALECMIAAYIGIPTHPSALVRGKMDLGKKPVFDQMRAEIVALLDRIDAIAYSRVPFSEMP